MNNEEKITQEAKDFIKLVMKKYVEMGQKTKLNIEVGDKRTCTYIGNKEINISVSNQTEANKLNEMKEKVDKLNVKSKEVFNEQENIEEDPLKAWEGIFAAKKREEHNALLEKYMKNFEPVKQETTKTTQQNHKKKRNLKKVAKTLNKKCKNFGNKVREVAKTKAGKTAIKVGSVIMATLLAGTTYSGVKKYVENYKDDAAVSSLNTVKEELGADAIYNNSTLTSSNSGIIQYVVVKGDKSYVFEAHITDGKINVLRNDGLDQQTRGAINTVARAQDGSFNDARRAKKLVEKIEDGEVNLFVDNEDYLSKRLEENNLEESSNDEMEIG